jgi:hypothetical protein
MSLKDNEFNTKVTSVSVSKELQALIEQFNFSPTDIYRCGVASKLCDIGYKPYVTPKNIKRNEYIKKFFSDINLEKIKKNLEDTKREIKELLTELNKIEK